MQSGFVNQGSYSPQYKNVNTSSRQSHGQSAGCLRLFIFLIPLLFGFFALSQGIQILNNYQGVTEQQELSNKVFDYVSDNLTAAPLAKVTMKAFTTEGTCDDGYDQAPWGTWKGLKAGSLCNEKNPLNHHNILVEHTTEYGYVHPTSCHVVPEQDAIDIDAWKTAAHKQNILCVQRVTNFNVTDEPCNTDASKGTVQVNIFEGKPSANGQGHEGAICADEKGIKTVTVAAAMASVATGAAADNHALPIIGFRIEGGAAAAVGCWLSDRTGPSASKKAYPLEVQQMGDCGDDYKTRKAGIPAPTVNDNFTPVAGLAGSNTMKEVWDTNFPAELTDVDTAPYKFNTTYPATDKYWLVAERKLFYGSHANCTKMEPQEYGNIDNMVADMKTTLNGLAITLIVLGSLIILTAVAFYMLRHTSLKDKNGNKCLYILFLLAVIISLALCITFFVYRYENQGLEEKSDDLKSISLSKCFDLNSADVNPALTALQSFTESSYLTYATPVWVLFWGTILAVLAAAYFIHTKQAAFPPVPLEDPFRE